MRAATRREKALQWLAVIAAAHDGFCDAILEDALEAGGLLRAVLFLYRAPAPPALQVLSLLALLVQEYKN